MKIYNYLGVELLDIEVDDKSYRYKELMSDNQLFLYFSLPYHIELPIGAYVDFKAERYFISDPENFKMNHTRDWEYTVVLDSYISLTKSTKFKFFTLVGGLAEGDFELKFSLTETAAEFAALFVQNMNNADPDGGWEVGDCIESEPILLDFNHTFCYDVLSELADKFKTEWEIEGKTLHLRKVEKLKESPTPLTYGYDSGLIPGFQRSNASKKKANRLYVETSERNIDSAAYGRKTLSMLKSATVVHNGINYVTDASGSYIERQGRAGLILENSADLTHIYPKRIGTVSNVIPVDAEKHLYDIVDLGIENDLDYNDYLIAGETMTLIFQTGDLAGLEFDVKYIHADRRFELVPISETGVTYPADALLPAIDNKYAVFHCSLPGSYLTSAETDATNEAAAELYEQEQDKYTYNGTLDELYAKRHWLEIGGFLDMGYFVRLTLQNAITIPVDIRIVAVKEYVNKPQQPEITLSNEASGKQLGSALASVKNKEQAVTRINNDTTRFARRQFADVKQTTEMLQNSLLNFSGAISPISVQAMQYIAGDESLQFEFVANSVSIASIPHVEDYDPATKRFTSAAGVLQHKTLGVTTLSSSHAASEFKWWTMTAYLSPVLDESSKSYYLYAKVSKTANTGIFLLSETAIALEGVAGYYHLLMGILNSENNGDRSYSQMYGYSELTPARLTVKKMVSPSGNMFVDLENEVIQGNIKFQSPGGGYKEVGAGIAEAVDAVEIGGINFLKNSNLIALDSTDYPTYSSLSVVENGIFKESTVTSLIADNDKCYQYQWLHGYFSKYPKANKNYVFSFDAKNNNSNSEVWFDLRGNGGITIEKRIVLPNTNGEWERFEISYIAELTTQDASLFGAKAGNAVGNYISIRKYQLEDGTKGTSYRAAPEDVEAAYKAYAIAKAELAETTAKAWTDGKVTAEEQRAITDATNKANAAQTAAINTAALDATTKANAAYTNAQGLVNNLQTNLQNQIDGQIISWFRQVDALLTNSPAVDWNTEALRNQHANDTYTNTSNGKCWRFQYNGSTLAWEWGIIADTATQQALTAAGNAQTTANSKITLFGSQPTTAQSYSIGDLWANATVGSYTNELLKCKTAKAVGIAFNVNHWEKATKYTDDTAVNNLEIGGRNIVPNSADYWFDGSDYAANVLLEKGKFTVLNSNVNTNAYRAWMNFTSGMQFFGKTLTLSFDVKITGVATGLNAWFNIRQIPEHSNMINTEFDLTTIASGIWKRISLSLTIPSNYPVVSPVGLCGFTGSNAIAGTIIEYKNIKCEFGNKPTDWTPAPEDVDASILTAQTAANAANSLLADIASDSKLTPNEKQIVAKEWEIIETEFQQIYNQSEDLGNAPDSYDDVHYWLSLYLSPLLANMNETSPINQAEFKTKFADYYYQKTATLNGISNAIKNRADAAQIKATALDYLKAAIAGSTTVNGGLVLGNMLGVKNALDVVTAGMNGIDTASLNDIRFWAGSTVENMLTAPFRVDELGNVYALAGNIGNFEIKSGGLVGYEGLLERVRLHTSPIPTLASLQVATYYRDLTNYIVSEINAGYVWNNGWNLEHTVYDENTEVSCSVTGKLTIPASTNIKLFSGNAAADAEGATGVTINTVSERFNITGKGLYTPTPSGTTVAIAAGVYDITYIVSVETTVAINGIGEIIINNDGAYIEVQDVAPSRTEIGNDGFFSFWTALKYFYYQKDAGLGYKGAMDIPGVLATGSVGSGGTHSNKWGAKVSPNNATYTATGIYDVPHSVGSSNYQVFPKAIGDGLHAYLISKGNNTFRVQIRNHAGTAVAGAFDYEITGNN